MNDELILISLYLLGSGFVGISFKKNTTFSLTESIILGLTCSIPGAICLVVDGLAFLSMHLLRAGLVMGGKEYTDVIKSYLVKNTKIKIPVVKGDEPDSEEK